MSFLWNVQHHVLFQSVPKSGDDGVVEIMSRRATVPQPIYGVVAAACPRPRGGTDRESRHVFRTGDAPNDVGLSIGVLDHSGINGVVKREPQMVEKQPPSLERGSQLSPPGRCAPGVPVAGLVLLRP